jgi:hypothetical protein
MYPNLPTEQKGVKVTKGNNGSTIFIVEDKNDKNIRPCLPGVVTEINGKEVTVSHEDFLKQDYSTLYVFDGKINVKESETVGLKTVLGTTSDELELFVLKNEKYIDSKKFFNTSFGNKNEKKYGKASTESQVRCLVQNIVAIPAKLIRGVKDDDPCSLYHKDDTDKKRQNFEQDNDKKSDSNQTDDTEKLGSEKEKWEFKQDVVTPTNSQPLPNQKSLNEEISRIKELLNL